MKKYIRVLTVLSLLMITIIPQKSWAQTASKPEFGDGSEENPFLISSAEELVWFGNWVNGKDIAEAHGSACAKLVKDIDMKGINMEPIGNPYKYGNTFYCGVFDGNGKSISNLKINYSYTFVGLFGDTDGATIRNITFINAEVECTSSNSATGILGGQTDNSIISGIKIINSNVKGTDYVGGIIGVTTSSTVVNCESNATVSGKVRVGGIIGYILESNSLKNILSLGNVTFELNNGGLLFGEIDSSAKVHCIGAVAYNKDANLTCSKSNITDSSNAAIGAGSLSSGTIFSCSKDILKSGFVTFILQQNSKTDDISWGQNLSEENGDKYPVLGSTYKVYAKANIKLNCNGTYDETGNYTNSGQEEEYELLMTHGSSTYKEGTPATCTQNGILNHYECNICHNAFKDQMLTQDLVDVTEYAKNHDYGTNDICTICNASILEINVGKNSIQITTVRPSLDKISGYNLFKFTSKEGPSIVSFTCDFGGACFSLWDSNKKLLKYVYLTDKQLAYHIEANTTYYIGVKYAESTAIDGNRLLIFQQAPIPKGLEGTGIKSDPFILKTAEHLSFFADYVNGKAKGTTTNDEAYAKIADDVDEIDMSSVCHPIGNGNETEISWTPISNTIFWEGTFDGNGKTISNLYINGSQQNVGLFGKINGTIKNLTLKNSIVTNTESNTGILLGYQAAGCYINNVKTYGSAKGANYTGGIVGYSMKGTVSYCENHATVAGQKYVGGIRGGSINNYSDGSFSNCSNYGQITGTDEYVGGIVGYIHGTYIGNCANYGSIKGKNRVGGIAGYTEYDHAENVLNYGDITSTEGNVVGALFGYVNNCKGFLAYNKEAKFTVNNQQKDANAIGSGSTGAVAATAFTKQQMESGEVAFFLNGSKSTGNLAWYQKLGENGDAYPVLTSTGDNKVYGLFHHRATERFYTNDANVKEHSAAYNAEAENEEKGNHDVSYEAGEYTWTDAKDMTQDPTVAVTYTCKVCGNTVTPEQMTVEHDAEHDNEAATCTEEGHKYYKTSYTFNDKAVFSNAYTQTLPALGHNMSDEVTFNDSKSIYQKGCTREDCGYHDYYATSDGSIKAEANDDESTFTVETFTLDDATAYDNKAKFTVKELTYKRTFKNEGWQAVYVPFDLICDQINPNDYEVATINNFHEYEQEDGSTKVELEVKRVIDWSDIPALTPCLIRKTSVPETEPAMTEELEFTDVKFVPAEDKSIDCASVTRYYQFLGSLEEKRDLNMDTDFGLVNGELWGVGQMSRISPQRWYLKATDRYEGLLTPSAQLSRIAIRVIGEGSATGIEEIHVTTDYGTANGGKQGIYDLQGRKLDQEPKSGIYIKNGKKYVK